MATIKAINGRTITIEHEGATADYVVLKPCTISLNGQPAKLGELDNDDEVVLGGITRHGISQIVATRKTKEAPSVRGNSTPHFPPLEGEISDREADKARRMAAIPNPEKREEVEKQIEHSNEIKKEQEEEENPDTEDESDNEPANDDPPANGPDGEPLDPLPDPVEEPTEPTPEEEEKPATPPTKKTRRKT